MQAHPCSAKLGSKTRVRTKSRRDGTLWCLARGLSGGTEGGQAANWLSKFKATPPPAAHAAAAKSPKKKVKKKKGSGPTVNTATKETQELAPKLTGQTGSLSVTAPEANVTEIHEFHPLMMWHLECQAPAPPSDLVSSIQIGDGPIVYGYGEASMVPGTELTVLMVTAEQDSRTEWLSGIDRLVISTAESSDGISLLSAMAGKGTHGDGTQAWMHKGFMSAVKGMQNADKDIQIVAMVCSSKYDKLGKEQAARRERTRELMGAEASDCEQVRPLEMFYNKVRALVSRVADSPELLAATDVQFLGLRPDDGDNDESEAMLVNTPPHPVSAGSLPTVAGTSAVDSPVVASDELAANLQDMAVDQTTPTKEAAVAMSMWEGIAATAVRSGPALPGDVVIMTIDSSTKIDVGQLEPVPVWGCLGKVLHHTKGHPDLKDYTVAVLTVCNTDLTTNTRLLRVARSGFDIVSREEVRCELDSPQATDVGINPNEPQPQNSPHKFGPQTFFRSHAPDFHPSRRLAGRTTRPHCKLLS